MAFIWYNKDNKYMKQAGNWDNSYRLFLLQALELTKTGRVLEMGCGNCSSPLLQAYCKENNRELYSYDNNKEWAEKFDGIYVGKTIADWEKSDYAARDYSVAFIDHSPGTHRPVAIFKLMEHVDIFVIHDTQPESDSGYVWNNIWNNFKYVDFYKEFSAWTVMASNTYNVARMPELR